MAEIELNLCKHYYYYSLRACLTMHTSYSYSTNCCKKFSKLFQSFTFHI